MLGIALVSVAWMIANTVWILLWRAERIRRIRAEKAASHLLSLCHAMNDGATFFVDVGGKPELRQ